MMDIVVLLFAVLFAVSAAIVARVVINMCKRRREAEEGQRRKTEKEAQERAEKEELERVEAERQRREEEQRKAEEERHKAQEEQKRREADEAQRKAKEELFKVEVETNRLEPGKRGGRPRSSTQDRVRQERQLIKQRRPKPEIICWKRERQWILVIEVPEDLLEKSSLTVLQNASHLIQHESREDCWCLEQASGQVEVHWNEDEVARETKIVIDEENYLLFKLSGQNQGRRVKFPSSGRYLVVVPENWERDEALSGSPPVTPEPVSLAGYRGHFFFLEKDDDKKIAFHTSKNEPFVIQSKASRFELVGIRLNDAREDLGPLFGERPPEICARDNQAWKDVGTIVVGEEGSGKGRWRKPLPRMPESKEQDLLAELAERRAGWYFLRFYDLNDDLVESLDFRFICALKEIRILQPSPLPSESGHEAVCVELFHKSGCVVQPTDGPASRAQIEHEDDKTILTIHPDPTCDETRWLVGPTGRSQVDVTVLVERVWWAFGGEEREPSKWVDRPFTLSREDFAPTSKKALWLRLPRRRWTDAVSVGFERSKARHFSVKVTEKTIAIPLRNFGDTKEVADRKQEYILKVFIERGEALIAGGVAKIPAQVTPPPGSTTSPKQNVVQTKALCKGGNVIYGNCRHCRKKAKEIRTKWIQ